MHFSILLHLTHPGYCPQPQWLIYPPQGWYTTQPGVVLAYWPTHPLPHTIYLCWWCILQRTRRLVPPVWHHVVHYESQIMFTGFEHNLANAVHINLLEFVALCVKSGLPLHSAYKKIPHVNVTILVISSPITPLCFPGWNTWAGSICPLPVVLLVSSKFY